MIESAMILAAGMGKRMRPLTDERPKPMIEVAGRCLIDHALDRLAEAGVGRAVVNLHYMADMLEAHLGARSGAPDIFFSDERGALLDTGGGVRQALPLLGDEAFFVLNSDMIWLDGEQNTLARLSGAWQPDRMDALMLMVPRESATGYDGQGDFHMGDDARLTRRGESESADYIYGGMHILHPRLLDGIDDAAFSLNRAWDRALAGGRLCGLAHTGEWMHVGAPEGVAEAEALLARREQEEQR